MILDYTTSIPAERSIMEVQKNLSSHGAGKIMTEYDGAGIAESLSFQVVVGGNPIAYRLACNWRKIQKIMEGTRVRGKFDAKQSQRIAWRIIKDWVEAQMAIIEAEQATLDQVFLPYAITNHGDTVYERVKTEGYLLGGAK
jgi:hypothetical protein